MSLLVASQAAMGEPLGYLMLLLATASLGIGFGLTVPSLNSYAAAFFPATVGKATLYLNALLGLGTALAPLLSALFLGLGVWWALPVAGRRPAAGPAARQPRGCRWPCAPRPRPPVQQPATRARPRSPPARFWMFAGFALLYGIVETVNGNWSTVYMSLEPGRLGGDGLAGAGRVLGDGDRRPACCSRPSSDGCRRRRTFRLLPFVAAAALCITALIPSGRRELGVLAFGLAGLGCSALLPLDHRLRRAGADGHRHVRGGAAHRALPGGLRHRAFGVGPLESMPGSAWAPSSGWPRCVALAMGALSFVVLVVVPRTGLMPSGCQSQSPNGGMHPHTVRLPRTVGGHPCCSRTRSPSSPAVTAASATPSCWSWRRKVRP